jgi:hypothetical protein
MSMSVTGAMSGSSGTTYNFTSVTNAEFQQEIQSLHQQGALTSDQSVLAILSASGGDSVPISGQAVSASQALSDTTKHDFIANFQMQDDWMHSSPGTVGTEQVDSLLQTLKAYQDKPIGSSNSVSTQA